jgi:hypothetical protein
METHYSNLVDKFETQAYLPKRNLSAVTPAPKPNYEFIKPFEGDVNGKKRKFAIGLKVEGVMPLGGDFISVRVAPKPGPNVRVSSSYKEFLNVPSEYLKSIDNKAFSKGTPKKVETKKYKFLVDLWKGTPAESKVGDIREGVDMGSSSSKGKNIRFTIQNNAPKDSPIFKKYGATLQVVGTLGRNVEEVIETPQNADTTTSTATFGSFNIPSVGSDKTVLIASSIGALAGLGWAYKKQSGVLGYIGYFLLGSIAGSLVAHIIKPKDKPADEKATPSEKGATPSERPASSPYTSDQISGKLKQAVKSMSLPMLPMMAAFGNMSVEDAAKKMDTEFDSDMKDPAKMEAMKTKYNALNDQEKMAMSEYLDVMINSTKGMTAADFSDKDKAEAFNKKVEAELDALKTKYPTVDLDKIMKMK